MDENDLRKTVVRCDEFTSAYQVLFDICEQVGTDRVYAALSEIAPQPSPTE
jgi:hypothetical protein